MGKLPYTGTPQSCLWLGLYRFLLKTLNITKKSFAYLRKNTGILTKALTIRIYNFALQYFPCDNFLKFTIPIACHVDNVLTVNQKLDFVGKEEEKWLIPGRSMLSILTDANLRDSANAGGGDWRPSRRSLSGSFCSPWITANPSRKRSAKDVALQWLPHNVNKKELLYLIPEVWLVYLTAYYRTSNV